jgi:hypothetical protein
LRPAAEKGTSVQEQEQGPNATRWTLAKALANEAGNSRVGGGCPYRFFRDLSGGLHDSSRLRLRSAKVRCDVEKIGCADSPINQAACDGALRAMEQSARLSCMRGSEPEWIVYKPCMSLCAS